jgi:hypothetical protein
LLEARPDRFIGVTLVGGSHVDSMRGGNPLIQFSQQLVSGFSTPENVAAAQILMVGWVTDMFAGNQEEGINLDPSEEFVFNTPAGEATVVALPNSLTKPFLLNPLQALVPLGNGFFTSNRHAGPPNPHASPPPRWSAWRPDTLRRRPPLLASRRRRKPRINGKLHTKHGVIS